MLLSLIDNRCVLLSNPFRIVGAGSYVAAEESIEVVHCNIEVLAGLLLRTKDDVDLFDTLSQGQWLQKEEDTVIYPLRTRILISFILIGIGIDTETLRETLVSSVRPRSALRDDMSSSFVLFPDLHTEALYGLAFEEKKTAGKDHVMENVVLIAEDVCINTEGDVFRSGEREMSRKLHSAPLAVPYNSFIVWVYAAINLDNEVSLVKYGRGLFVYLSVDGKHWWVVALSIATLPTSPQIQISRPR